jgi:hypothetical protein
MSGSYVENRILDLGLNEIAANGGRLYLVHNASEPTTYALASTGPSSLGFAAISFNSPTTDGTKRKVTSNQIDDGTITTTGTAGWWAVCDAINSRLLVHGAFSATQEVTEGNTFSLIGFDIAFPLGLG